MHALQTPPTQVSPGLHFAPHAPQSLGSFNKSTEQSGQQLSFGQLQAIGLPQIPSLQYVYLSQTLPHEPQFFESW
jgi:hypothetical protein